MQKIFAKSPGRQTSVTHCTFREKLQVVNIFEMLGCVTLFGVTSDV